MAALAHPSLTNSQPLGVRPWPAGAGACWRGSRRRCGCGAGGSARGTHWRSLTERELADFGASSADVYRELGTPFWRVAAAVLSLTTPRRSIER